MHGRVSRHTERGGQAELLALPLTSDLTHLKPWHIRQNLVPLFNVSMP